VTIEHLIGDASNSVLGSSFDVSAGNILSSWMEVVVGRGRY
jgi:hypothetical protein